MFWNWTDQIGEMCWGGGGQYCVLPYNVKYQYWRITSIYQNKKLYYAFKDTDKRCCMWQCVCVCVHIYIYMYMHLCLWNVMNNWCNFLCVPLTNRGVYRSVVSSNFDSRKNVICGLHLEGYITLLWILFSLYSVQVQCCSATEQGTCYLSARG